MSTSPNLTPFQLELTRLMRSRAAGPAALSGRALSQHLGKSSNHIWQIMNRAMVPSGTALLELARALGLSRSETDGLILKAVETKAVARSRDVFWVQQVLRMVSEQQIEVDALRGFLMQTGLYAQFEDWDRLRRAAKRTEDGSAPGVGVTAPES